MEKRHSSENVLMNLNIQNYKFRAILFKDNSFVNGQIYHIFKCIGCKNATTFCWNCACTASPIFSA